MPRDQQVLLGRQNIFDGTWQKTPSMGWSFLPLTSYKGGGPDSVIEPLCKHLDAYDAHLAQNFGSGIQCCYRGSRLYDTDATQGGGEATRGLLQEVPRDPRQRHHSCPPPRRPRRRLHVARQSVVETAGPGDGLQPAGSPREEEFDPAVVLHGPERDGAGSAARKGRPFPTRSIGSTTWKCRWRWPPTASRGLWSSDFPACGVVTNGGATSYESWCGHEPALIHWAGIPIISPPEIGHFSRNDFSALLLRLGAGKPVTSDYPVKQGCHC